MQPFRLPRGSPALNHGLQSGRQLLPGRLQQASCHRPWLSCMRARPCMRRCVRASIRVFVTHMRRGSQAVCACAAPSVRAGVPGSLRAAVSVRACVRLRYTRVVPASSLPRPILLPNPSLPERACRGAGWLTCGGWRACMRAFAMRVSQPVPVDHSLCVPTET